MFGYRNYVGHFEVGGVTAAVKGGDVASAEEEKDRRDYDVCLVI